MDNKKFDLWADNYDVDVELTYENNEYPFAGYKEVVNIIYNFIKNTEGESVLDIGFGTGKLTKILYNENYNITGVDFSEEMIKIASSKMPNANLIKFDFSKGLPIEIIDEKYDYIISSYAIHHLNNNEKLDFINRLYGMLNENGKIIIGDISFINREKLEECKRNCGDNWDDEEYYIVYEELKDKLDIENISFYEISFCSGVLILEK